MILNAAVRALLDGRLPQWGCRAAIVEPLLTAEQPTALVDLLRKHGIIPV